MRIFTVYSVCIYVIFIIFVFGYAGVRDRGYPYPTLPLRAQCLSGFCSRRPTTRYRHWVKCSCTVLHYDVIIG